MPVPATDTNVGFGWVVQSFSGESIRTATSRIVKDIVPRYLRQHRTAIVCSACVPTVSYSTSLLLYEAASKARRHRSTLTKPKTDEPDSLIVQTAEWFRIEYMNLTHQLLCNNLLVESMRRVINMECDWLCSCVEFAHDEKLDDIDDLLVLTSERLTSQLMSRVLNQHGFQTELLFAEEIEACVREAQHQDEGAMEDFRAELAMRVQSCYPKIPIITGVVRLQETVKTPQAGFSETLSVLLAISLQAIELQLWDSGNGVITADSRRVSTARFIGSISSAEAVELAQHGHPCTSSVVLDQATSKDIAIKLGDSNDAELRSTTIQTPSVQHVPTLHLKPVEPLRILTAKPQIVNRRPTAVIINDTAFLIKVTAHTATSGFGFMSAVFRVLQNHRVDPEMLSSTATHVAVVVDVEKFQGDVGALADEMGEHGIVLVQSGISIITLVGDQMRHNVGISGHVVSTLTQGGIRVNMIGPGTGMSLSCAIGAKDLTKAVRLLHQTIFRKLGRNRTTSSSVLQ